MGQLISQYKKQNHIPKQKLLHEYSMPGILLPIVNGNYTKGNNAPSP